LFHIISRESDSAALAPLPKSKRFVELPVPAVFELTERYFRQHPEWEPETKTGAARSFNRARPVFLRLGAEPAGEELVALEDFLSRASFLPAHLEGRMTDRQRTGRAWLEMYPAAADSLTSAQIEAFCQALRDQSARSRQAGIGRHAHRQDQSAHEGPRPLLQPRRS